MHNANRVRILLAQAAFFSTCSSAWSQLEEPFPAIFNINQLRNNGGNPELGFVVIGGDVFGDLGGSVSPAGDINDDGFDDFIVGAPSGVGSSRNLRNGSAHVIYGRPAQAQPVFSAVLDLSTLPESAGFSIVAPRLDDELALGELGVVVTALGDANGDGIDDVAIAAPGLSLTRSGNDDASPNGAVVIVFGRPTTIPGVPAFPATLSIDEPGNAAIVHAAGCSPSLFPVDAAGVGDINADGYNDVLVSQRDGIADKLLDNVSLRGTEFSRCGDRPLFGDPIDMGLFHVIYGTSNIGSLHNSGFPAFINDLNGTNGFSLFGPPVAPFSLAVGAAGDFNDDGTPDMLTGGLGLGDGFIFNPFDPVSSFCVYGSPTLSGPQASFVNLANISDSSTTLGFAVRDTDLNGDFNTPSLVGTDVAGIGDINNDGIGDIAFGSSTLNQEPGTSPTGGAYILFGRDGVSQTDLLGIIDAATLDGADGFFVFGNNVFQGAELFGSPVNALGDINDDLIDDFCVVSQSAAQVLVVYGRNSSSPFPGILRGSDLDGTNGVVFTGTGINEAVGIGDVNGDGVGDIAISSSGDVIVVYGRECVADVNGDGELTPADFSAWVGAFNSGAPGCDQNGDNICSQTDLSAFVANFNAGCP